MRHGLGRCILESCEGTFYRHPYSLYSKSQRGVPFHFYFDMFLNSIWERAWRVSKTLSEELSKVQVCSKSVLWSMPLQILRLFSESAGSINGLKEDLADARKLLGARHKQLHQQWCRSVTLRHVITLLDQIDKVAQVLHLHPFFSGMLSKIQSEEGRAGGL